MDEYKPTFGILVPARRGFGTPAGDPCCCHASPPSPFVNRREREREDRGSRCSEIEGRAVSFKIIEESKGRGSSLV